MTALVADLMSRGVQTLDPDAKLETVVRKMRLIGHEGFPVVENGRVIGLLTRRDTDRALEHGLGDLRVREVMSAGAVTLHPDDSVALLERRMVESGWGQIPVVTSDGALIGIVTRTDLIRYWAQAHPDGVPRIDTITSAQISAILGQPISDLIDLIARQAQDQQLDLYMVGGIVRDLLLRRANDDIDFVVQGDAIRFAEGLQQHYGGEVHSYRPFGTATWHLEGTSIKTAGMPMTAGLPSQVDFASARSEFYEHPTALPTVYGSSIKLDLQRRDFTINTLAVQLSPAQGRILDFYGGMADLDARLIRVLHSLSFVDDPTRILRAVRFERRLKFEIEPRTVQLIDTALPMLRRITGERIRNEFTLLLREADAAGGFLLLQARGILQAVHPAFVVPDDLVRRLEAARAHADSLPWMLEAPDAIDLDWCLLLSAVPVSDLPDLCARLVFSKTLTDAVLDTARLVQNLDRLIAPDLPPSKIVAQLDGISDLALLASWLIAPSVNGQKQIWRYANEWRSVKTSTNGHTLRARGLKPGPCFAAILARLRAARLDGEVSSDTEEDQLLQRLLEGEFCNDSAG